LGIANVRFWTENELEEAKYAAKEKAMKKALVKRVWAAG
jgi:hypothetical protein